jgi:hypothetical protein
MGGMLREHIPLTRTLVLGIGPLLATSSVLNSSRDPVVHFGQSSWVKGTGSRRNDRYSLVRYDA